MDRPDKKSFKRVNEVIKEEKEHLIKEHEAPKEVIKKFNELEKYSDMLEKELDIKYDK